VDAAIIDGVASMMGMFNSLKGFGMWTTEREDNLLDGGAPFYRCYETSDKKYMAVGCIEPQFFALMLEITGISPDDYGHQNDKSLWPKQHALLERTFASKTRDEWAELFDGTDACVSPVLNMEEAQEHPHNKARKSHLKSGNFVHPHPAPRFGGETPDYPASIPKRGADTAALLKSVGCSEETIELLT